MKMNRMMILGDVLKVEDIGFPTSNVESGAGILSLLIPSQARLFISQNLGIALPDLSAGVTAPPIQTHNQFAQHFPNQDLAQG